MKQLTRAQAMAFNDTHKWEAMDAIERSRFQLNQDRLCMPFAVFHQAITEALGRPVYVHELASISYDAIKAEFEETHK